MASRRTGASATKPSSRVCLGVITGAHGVRGTVRVRPFTAEPEAVSAYGEVSTEDGTRHFGLTVVGRAPKAQVLVQLTGVGDRAAAKALKGTRLFVPRERLPPAGEEEYYHADLIGLAVEEVGGRALGTVTSVHNFGGGDVLEVVAAGGTAIMVPFTRAVVPVIDLAGGRIVIDPPPGLLEEEG